MNTPHRRPGLNSARIWLLLTGVATLALCFVIGSSPISAQDNSELQVGPTIRVAVPQALPSVPTVAVHGDRVWVAWGEYDETTEMAFAYIASSEDGGQTFSAPQQFGTGGTEYPNIAATDDGTLFLSHLEWAEEPLIDDYYLAWLVLHRSVDGGQTWELVGQTPDSAATFSQPYEPELAVSADGSRVLLTWLDATPAQYLPPDALTAVEGTMSTPVWVSFSADGGQTFSTPSTVIESSCSCCRSKPFFIGETPAIAYRDLESVDDTHDERDMYVITMADDGTWQAPVEVHNDGFTLDLQGCPTSGPGADAQDGAVQVAWWTGAQDRAGYWLATGSADTFGTPISLPDTNQHFSSLDLEIAPSGDSFVLASDVASPGETAAGAIGHMLRVFHVSGDVAQEVETATANDLAPQYGETYDIAASDTGVVIVWLAESAEGQTIMFRRIDQ